MRILPKPSDENNAPYVATQVFGICIGTITDDVKRNRLAAIEPDLAVAAQAYDIAAAAGNLHTFPGSENVGTASAEEIKAIYTERLVPRKQPARRIYDRIFKAPALGRCPLCDIGNVSTLDHHLPKSDYTLLSVTPNNLVPSCWNCQREKLAEAPKTFEEQTLHPYFDNFEGEIWLRARVQQVVPAAFEFYVGAPPQWHGPIAGRLESHLMMFGLKELYASNAAGELAGMRRYLNEQLFAKGGAAAVRNHLSDSATSWENEFKNSWKAAMYRAGAVSDWFCEGGFLQT